MATDICHRVIKYSFATGLRQNNSVPWQHYQSDNLFAVIKGSDTRFHDGRLRPDGKLDMKIVDRTEVMESVDIARYIDDAIETRRRAQEAGITTQIEQLPIFGITQDSLLALRFRLKDGQARRLQLRLEDSAKCKQIVSAFERRGMEFQEKRPRTARPGTGRSATAASANRRTSSYMQSSSQSFGQTLPADVIQVCEPLRPRNDPAMKSRPIWLPQEAAAPAPYSRDETAAPRDVVPDRPTTSQMYRCLTTPNQQSQNEMHALSNAFQRPERPASSSHLGAAEQIRDMVEADGTPPHVPILPSDAMLQSDQSVRSAMASSNPAQILTSTTTAPPPESQEFELPPRRELPFKRPDSKRSGTGKVSSSNPPPLIKSKPAQGGSNDTARPSTASPPKRSAAAVEDHTGRPQTSMGLSSGPIILPPAKPSLSRMPLPTRPMAAEQLNQPRRMDELLSSHNSSAQRTTNAQIPRVSSLVDAEHEIDPEYAPTKKQGPAVHDAVTSAFAAIRAPADPNATTLEEYATQSYQDRQAALEQFMYENLENPAFTKLCEDVDNCWRRVALGL